MMELRLYIAGKSRKSETALTNANYFFEKFFKGNYNLEIIDLVQQPDLAERDQILAIPTLIRKKPGPAKRIIGDLSDMDKLLKVDIIQEFK